MGNGKPLFASQWPKIAQFEEDLSRGERGQFFDVRLAGRQERGDNSAAFFSRHVAVTAVGAGDFTDQSVRSQKPMKAERCRAERYGLFPVYFSALHISAFKSGHHSVSGSLVAWAYLVEVSRNDKEGKSS